MKQSELEISGLFLVNYIDTRGRTISAPPFMRRRFGAGQLGAVPFQRRTFGRRFLFNLYFSSYEEKTMKQAIP